MHRYCSLQQQLLAAQRIFSATGIDALFFMIPMGITSCCSACASTGVLHFSTIYEQEGGGGGGGGLPNARHYVLRRALQLPPYPKVSPVKEEETCGQGNDSNLSSKYVL